MTHSDRSDGADRIELLRTFVRVVEAGSFSAVAAQTGTTQPTISRRLKALEKEFGLPLLHRSTHALHLTADGERCLDRARELLAAWDALRADVRGGGGGDEVEGVLRVVVPHAFGQDYFVRVLADFLQANPKVHVEWMLHDDRSMHDYISAGIDCAIQIGEVRALGVVAIKLSEVPRVAAAAPELLVGLLRDRLDPLGRIQPGVGPDGLGRLGAVELRQILDRRPAGHEDPALMTQRGPTDQ